MFLTTTINQLTTGTLNNFEIPFPSKEEQINIAHFLDNETRRIDELVEEKNHFIELLKEKRQALISHVVTKGLDPTVKMKDSGVEWLGEVPVHWTVLKIRRISALQQGLQIAQDQRFYEEGVNRLEYITIKSINSGSFGNKEYIDSPSKNVICNIDDVLMARTGATGEVITDVKGVFHNNFFKIKYDGRKIIKYYLVYLFKMKEIKSHLLLVAGTTTIPDLNHDGFLDVKITLPSLLEQISIVNYLDRQTTKIDALITETQNSIALLKEHRTALISAAVTGKIDVREVA
jgi:type I restriction enzyme S subunit